MKPEIVQCLISCAAFIFVSILHIMLTIRLRNKVFSVQPDRYHRRYLAKDNKELCSIISAKLGTQNIWYKIEGFPYYINPVRHFCIRQLSGDPYIIGEFNILDIKKCVVLYSPYRMAVFSNRHMDIICHEGAEIQVVLDLNDPNSLTPKPTLLKRIARLVII